MHRSEEGSLYGTPLEDMPCGGYESPEIKGEGGVLVASNGGTGATDSIKGTDREVNERSTRLSD